MTSPLQLHQVSCPHWVYTLVPNCSTSQPHFICLHQVHATDLTILLSPQCHAWASLPLLFTPAHNHQPLHFPPQRHVQQSYLLGHPEREIILDVRCNAYCSFWLLTGMQSNAIVEVLPHPPQPPSSWFIHFSHVMIYLLSSHTPPAAKWATHIYSKPEKK